jgi:hypothetical protein
LEDVEQNCRMQAQIQQLHWQGPFFFACSGLRGLYPTFN